MLDGGAGLGAQHAPPGLSPENMRAPAVNKTWNGQSSGSNLGKPLTFFEKVIVAFLFVTLCVVGVLATLAVEKATQDREVWWTVACPSEAQPDRVCLDGSVTLDQLPQWAGGTKQE